MKTIHLIFNAHIDPVAVHLGRRSLRQGDWTMLWCADGATIGVVAPDVYALDVTPQRARFTPLRSPRMAWHDTSRRNDPRDRCADRGEHESRFRFYGLWQRDDRYLGDQALMLQRPLAMADLTRGMLAKLA